MSEPLTPTEQDRLVRYCLQEATHHRATALAAPAGSTLALIEQHTATAYVIVATLAINPEPRASGQRGRAVTDWEQLRLDGIAEAFDASAASHSSEGVAHADLLESYRSDLREWIDQ